MVNSAKTTALAPAQKGVATAREYENYHRRPPVVVYGKMSAIYRIKTTAISGVVVQKTSVTVISPQT
jgi:hypothetical protein